jgi:AraC family transcriptional regulator
MPSLLTPNELPKWVPGKILCASDELGWIGVALRSYHYKGLDVAVPAMRDFIVIAYRHGTTRMQRRFDGAWTKTRCEPGDISLLTRSQNSHWHWTDDIEVNHVYLSEQLVSNVASEVMGRSVADVQLHDVLKTQDATVTSIVGAIAQEAEQKSVGGALYVESLGTMLAVHMLRHYASVTFREEGGKQRLSPQQAKRIVEYIDSRLPEALGLDALAEVTGLGVWSFSRRFRETFGRAPHAYVIDRRVECAQHLLTQGTMPVKEVASTCGFADQAHMTRVFQLRLHTTPAAFRRKIQF